MTKKKKFGMTPVSHHSRMNTILKIWFLLWSVPMFGQQSKEESLKECHAAYKRHLDRFKESKTMNPTDYETNYDEFRKLFTHLGVKIYNPLQHINKPVSIETYVEALGALSDNATIEFQHVLYCRDEANPKLYYIHFEQSFRGQYTTNRAALPVVWLTMSVLESDGFKIAGIGKADPNAATDADDDGDGIANRCDKCRNIVGSLEYWGADPVKPCTRTPTSTSTSSKPAVMDLDGDGTPDATDKCPTGFGEPEDGGCPNYTPAERVALGKIEMAKKIGAESLDLSGLYLKRLPSAVKQLTGLKSLNLFKNQISDVSVLHDLKQLVTLDLSYNEIQQFNLDLNQMPNLNYLKLYQNPIKKIPKEIIGDDSNNCAAALRAYQKQPRK
jgi:hypothetical protein